MFQLRILNNSIGIQLENTVHLGKRFPATNFSVIVYSGTAAGEEELISSQICNHSMQRVYCLLYNLEGYIHGKRDKGRQCRNWIDDLKDWTGIKNFGALKQTVED